MHNIDSLDKLPVGQTARVEELRLNGSIRRRMQDIGLIEGTPVECLQKMPFRRSCGLFDPRRRHRSTPGGFRPRHGAFQLTFPCAPP